MENRENRFIIPMILFLLVAIGVLGFVGYEFFKENKTVKVPDFSNKNISEVNEWCGSLNSKYSCEIVYEESKTVEKDKIISQSIKADEALKDKITFKVSSGLILPVDPFVIKDNSKLSDVQSWAKTNNIQTLNVVEEENNDLENGKVIRIEPTDQIYKDTVVTVYVAKSSNTPETNTNGNITVNAGAYIGKTVSEFENYVKKLGLKPNHNTDRDEYSSNVEKGRIVWHGSGDYVENETINYGLSLGKSSGTSDEINIKQNEYQGLSVSDFETKVKALGLTPVHETSWDVNSDSVDKGKIVRHGYTTYTKGENIRYGLSLGKKDDSSSDEINIKQNEFQGLSLSEFESKIKALGLNPYHESTWDNYSDTIEKGKIIRHGYTSYTKGENMRYGLSLGKKGDSSSDEIYINQNQFLGLTVSEFESKVKALGLNPYHESAWDVYSDSVDKGKIVRHGYTSYIKGENIRYGLSLGKKESTPSEPTISVRSFANEDESVLTKFLSDNGLNSSRSEQYSNSVASGKIISNTTGNLKKSDTVKYVVSKGVEPVATKYLASFSDINNKCYATNDYEKASNNVKTFLSNAGFTNYEVIFESSRDAGVGTLISITVDGNKHVSGANYAVNSKIVVSICNELDAG